MNDRLRREVIAYFDEEVGRPPAGVRERVLTGSDRGRGPSARGQWLATGAAVAMALLAVAVLLAPRLAQRAGVSPARNGTGIASPAPAPSSTMTPYAGEAPPSRYGMGVASGPGGGLVVFGGVLDGAGGPPGPAIEETWTWVDGRWTLKRPSTSPSRRRDSLMAYDAARGVVVLLGGRTQTGIGPQEPGLSDTWTWDGRGWTEHPSTVGPAFRQGAAMTYDPGSRSVLWYGAPRVPGGQGSAGTWRWDGQGWSRVQSAAQPTMISSQMAWDGHRVLLFGRAPVGGGPEAGGGEVMETWAWSADRGWTRLSPTALPPPAILAAAFDQEHQRLVALVQPVVGEATETWVWDGETWTRQATVHQPPALTYGGSAVYDTSSRQVLVYGRQVRSPVCELWAWDGRDWRQIARWS
jgi:hypothetical protein